MNYQARQRLGCGVYLIFDAGEWMLIDIGFEDTVPEIVEMIRRMDFPLAHCKYLVATHADVDHIQGLARAKQLLKTTVTSHPISAEALEKGDLLATFAEIEAQDIHLAMPAVKVENASCTFSPSPMSP